MRTADYIDIFNATAHACRLQLDATGTQLATEVEFVALRTLHSLRLATIWRAHRWPDLCPMEKRYFRDLWNSATAYTASTATAPVEVYYPASQKYYQALTASTGQAPATLSGSTWSTNTAYWAESASSYSANNYAATTAYVRGDQVYWPDTDLAYQLYAATSTGNAPSDATKWGVLTNFDRYIAYAQTGQTTFEDAFDAWSANPRVTPAACRYASWLSNHGLQVSDLVAYAYLDYRLNCPVLSGNVYDATVAYAAGQQAHYASATSRGNFWTVATGGTNTGDTPESAPSKFTLVSIPLAFSKYLVHGAAADYFAPIPEQADQAGFNRGLAELELERLGLITQSQLASQRQSQTRTR